MPSPDIVAPIGVAMISRNAAETIGICLDSIRPYVQQIVIGLDETTTDDTEKIAKEHGADIIQPIKVSDWHECPQHGRILAQHFADARNASFQLLDSQLDFWMWLDSDDIVKNPEKLAAVCEAMLPTESVGAWLRYDYATMKGGEVTSTRFHRERILRVRDRNGQPIRWEWKHRVHETVVPILDRVPSWTMLDDPAIYHQEKGHNSTSSAARNIILLEIDLEDNPQDERATFYLGNQYFAMGDMRAATYWYERLGDMGKNEYEMWQSWCYCSIAYERLGDLDNATKAAFCAIDINPKHPEPYQRLASIYLLAGKFDKVEYWTQQASLTESSPPKTEPPFFVFKNPLDYSFNSKMPLADALAAQGRIKEARKVLEEAYRALPDERVGKAIEHYQSLEAAEQQATSFYWLYHDKSDAEKIAAWEHLRFEPVVKQFGRVRNVVVPAYLKTRIGRPRIAFLAGGVEEWSPESLNTTGIGGSETAIVEIAKCFAREGWQVDVFNNAGRYEGVYEDVGYWDNNRYPGYGKADVFVSWRQPSILPREGCTSLLWLHDLNYGPQATPFLQAWEKEPRAAILGVSQWHADMLKTYYGLDRVDFVPNGIDPSRFPHLQTREQLRKEAFQCVYASSPDRGLERLLHLWERVVEREPGATLHLAYGWNNIEKMIQTGRASQHQVQERERILKLLDRSKNVVWHGRLPQDKLAELYMQSAVFTFPTHFLEVSCISAVEAMAGGAVPVTTACGALPETIGDAGLLVTGVPNTRTWQTMWLEVLMGCLASPQVRWPKQYAGYRRALTLTWDAAYAKWKQVIEGLRPEELHRAAEKEEVLV